jgi:DNA polymerase-4
MSLRILFIDFNSYFASVEQHLRPELRGRPVAVAPVVAPSGCCIAASYEAKAFGVKTGMRVRDAMALCPNIEIVNARPSVYVRVHHRLIEAIDTCIPIEGVHSIDEMSCRLAPNEREPGAAAALAGRIKRAIREHVGETMRCSIGVAPNRFLAKVATDMQKPDGLVVIQRHELPGRLYGLDLIDLPGIGPRMNKRLQSRGICTVEQLCALDEPRMVALWESVLGSYWHLWLRGEITHEAPTRKRSIGHQHVLPPALRTDEQARAVAIRLLHKAAARMRQMEYAAGRLTLNLSIDPAGGGGGGGASGGFGGAGGWHSAGWHASVALPDGCRDTVQCTKLLARLWSDRPLGRPKQVGVIFSELVADACATAPLFAEERKSEELCRAVDAINERFGRNAVYSAAVHQVRDSARGGIAFTYVPDLDAPDGVA